MEIPAECIGLVNHQLKQNSQVKPSTIYLILYLTQILPSNV